MFLNTDQWDGYQPARDRLYAVLKGGDGQPAVDNVVGPWDREWLDLIAAATRA